MVVRSLQDPLEDLVLFVAAVVFMLLSLLVESKSGVVDEVALGVVIVYLEFGLEFLVGDIYSADLNMVLVSTGCENSGDILHHDLEMLVSKLMEGHQNEVVCHMRSILIFVFRVFLVFSCGCLHLLMEVRS